MSDQPDQQTKKPFLYVVVCASGIAGDVGKLITAAQEAHWDVGVIATPQGLGFIDTTAVEAQTGYPIRSAWRSPGDPRPLPPADAIAVAPGAGRRRGRVVYQHSDLERQQEAARGLDALVRAARDKPAQEPSGADLVRDAQPGPDNKQGPGR
ncbi:hypothetical protein ACWIG5_00280 [Streptomyces lydicus]